MAYTSNGATIEAVEQLSSDYTAIAGGWWLDERCRVLAFEQKIEFEWLVGELTDAIAVPGSTIMEARFHNPSFDPFHCPPATTQVHFKNADGQTERMAFYYAPRPEHEPQRRHLSPDAERTVILI